MRSIATIASSILFALLPMQASAQDFEGPHAGVQGGWQQSEVSSPETNLGTLPLDSNQQSFTGGFFVGYDRQVAPRVVLGVEGGMDFAASDAVTAPTGTGFVRIDPEWSIDLTARAGYLVTPQTLTYLRGGYTNVRAETTITNGAIALMDNENRNGWLVGAGIEQRILQNISGRLEYRYSDLSEGDGTYDRHRILAGIAYRF